MEDLKEKNDSIKKEKKSINIRGIVQAGFFILVALISLNEVLAHSGIIIPFIPKASLHAICPFGGVVSFYNFVTVGTFVQKIHQSSFILMILVFFLAILFGPIVCGWICPFGTFQEWIAKIGMKIFGEKYNNFVPKKADKYLRYIRYVVLAMVIYTTATTAKLAFSTIDPYYALFNFFTHEVTFMAGGLLIVIIGLSLFIERPWCKYACPYGALMGLTNLFRVFKIKRNPSTCIDCKKCDKACPMNIKVSTANVVRDHQCISCMKCTSEESCPVKNTVDFTTKTK